MQIRGSSGEAVASLAPIPGGWISRRITVGGNGLDIALPADPDAFLDDPAIM